MRMTDRGPGLPWSGPLFLREEDSAASPSHLCVMTEPPDLNPPPDERPCGLIALLLDPITMTVVLATALMLVVFYHHGNFPWLPPRLQRARLGWFGLNFVCLFIVPALFTTLVLHRPLRDLGLRSGDGRLSLRFAALYGGVTIPVIIIASRFGAFQAYYSSYSWGPEEIGLLVISLAGWAVYFFAWEFFFRGFLLQVLGGRFGSLAVPLQMMPFTMAHFTKPEAESAAAIIAGIALGWWAWRTESFIGPWLLHWLCSAVMILSVLLWPAG